MLLVDLAPHRYSRELFNLPRVGICLPHKLAGLILSAFVGTLTFD